jgi:hypothetical protein
MGMFRPLLGAAADKLTVHIEEEYDETVVGLHENPVRLRPVGGSAVGASVNVKFVALPFRLATS